MRWQLTENRRERKHRHQANSHHVFLPFSFWRDDSDSFFWTTFTHTFFFYTVSFCTASSSFVFSPLHPQTLFSVSAGHGTITLRPRPIQMLSLNLSNVVLMLVLKGLIWGASYMRLGGGSDGKGRADVESDGVVTETDLLLFLGYLVADESGRYDCLNRVACEKPSRAERYLNSAEMVWNAGKMLDGWGFRLSL